MEKSDVQDLPREHRTESRSHAHFWENTRPRPFRGLWVKLILPYLVLTAAMAWIGIFVITTLVVGSETNRFRVSMLEASRVANDEMVNQEKNQLEKLRYVIFSTGMGQSVYDKDSEQIYNLMRPVLANSNINLISAIDTDGREIVTYGRDSTTQEYHRQEKVDFAGVESVRKVLEGVSDNQGDKFAELLTLKQGPILFTAAPIRDANQKLVGAIMVGTYLKDILTELKQNSLSDVIVLDTQNKLIGTTLNGNEEGFENLISAAAKLKPGDQTKTQDVSLNQYPFEVAYSPLIIRDTQVGWIGVIKSSAYLSTQKTSSLNLFIGIFTVGTLAVVVIGYSLAQNIARPILRLRSIAQSVAAGDLNQKAGLHRSDEIGDLAESFDVMTMHLRERTEEAERLYTESLQRNKELAEINARLEAAQLQLIQSEKLAAIGQLTAGIVHDVKNPFAVIMGMAEVLNEEGDMDEATTRHGLKVIRESAIKGNNIVSDLLKFARQSKPEMRRMDLRETVHTVLRLTAYLTRRYSTTVNLPEKSLILTYDAQLIEQVLVNMIHNAVQAMPNGGSLEITLKQIDDNAHLVIRDTGCGIPPEHLKRIFDPFFTTKAEGEGTGLGLSVSYGIIANHRGRIDVESEVGKGSTFRIVLPMTQPPSMTEDEVL